MKQLTIAFTTLLTATLAMSNVAYADEQADKQAIIEAYHAIDTAIQNKDFNQASSFYAPEYTRVGIDGKVNNFEQLRKGMQQFLQNTRQINVMREQQIKINGQTATVVGIGYQTAIVSDPNNPQVPMPVSSVFRYQDTWKRTDNGWKAANTHMLTLQRATGQSSTKAAPLSPVYNQNQMNNFIWNMPRIWNLGGFNPG